MEKRRFKVMTVFGTRPEAIKMAPVVKALEKHALVDSRVVVTAQHREMLDQVVNLFKITPHYDLDLMRHGQTLAGLTSGVMEGMDRIFMEEKPDMILVQGDTTTTFVSGLAAFYHRIPVGHVEAGLRTGEKYSPWPEEINRRLTTGLADLHFAPTEVSRNNLLREGIPPQDIFITGNTVIDALMTTVQEGFRFQDQELDCILNSNQNKRLILMTTHRRENWGEPMRQIYQALETVLDENPDSYVIFPVHKNPTVRRVVAEVLGNNDRVFLIEPLDYEPFVNLLSKAYLILTDSGGIQEEAPSLGKPVLCVRDTTERPEAVEAGTVLLVGTKYENVLANLTKLLSDKEAYKNMSQAANPYGDGTASVKIAEIVVKYLINC
ncbi:MAG: UDP-N-acetylglucosamine 2-epimerase [Candidatus Dichloromethanomonas elyunquensis]|nr:MAG: UDP-N-acetylglucosamine 2-epimerase [Candidatus Dichloromethanomonas elyunquensis]